MARGRMIDQRFVKSEKLRTVTRDARLVYASLLPFLDREGRMCAEPIVLKANVFRRTDFSLEEIPVHIAELASVGLIKLYADQDHDAILEVAAFLEFNSPNRNERASVFPAPDDEERVLPLRDESLLTALSTPQSDARAMHMQSTGTAHAPAVQRTAGARKVSKNTAPSIEATGASTKNHEIGGSEPEKSSSEEHHQLPAVQDKPVQDAKDSDARAMHMQSTCKENASEVQCTPRTLTGTLTRTRSKTLSSPDGAEVERKARRPNIDYEKFMATWNDNRGPLPRAQALNATRKRGIARLVKEHGPEEALALLRDATREVAADDFYIKRQYNFDVLLAGNKILGRAEAYRNHRGLSEGNRALASTVARLARAVEGTKND